MSQPKWRGIFCNRTLNMRPIRAIGYDMDYTLIHYHVDQWERRAFEHVQRKMAALGWPVEDFTFDQQTVGRGLIIDRELGNLVKANRFGYVKAASHGTRMLDYDEWRRAYARTVVDLSEPRWVFLNTLFEISEACLYGQLVDRLDAGGIPGVMGYSDLYAKVRASVDEAHMEGELKAEIMADPDRFVDLDPEVPLTLLDQKHAGKTVLLITNSGWIYTRAMMEYAFTPFLPEGMTWQDVFDYMIVAARKPSFFSGRNPVYEIVDESGLCRPHNGKIQPGKVYLGGSASLVEETLGLNGEEILYVGDHAYSDVKVSKDVRRWRTALVLRELESELVALDKFQDQQAQITHLMDEKTRLEHVMSEFRLDLQRARKGYLPTRSGKSIRELEAKLGQLRARLTELDARIAPLAKASGEMDNTRWGLLMRAGNDKSHLARQVERHADIYTSRVSNLYHATPFVYLRSPRGSLPHDPGAPEIGYAAGALKAEEHEGPA